MVPCISIFLAFVVVNYFSSSVIRTCYWLALICIADVVSTSWLVDRLRSVTSAIVVRCQVLGNEVSAWVISLVSSGRVEVCRRLSFLGFSFRFISTVCGIVSVAVGAFHITVGSGSSTG